LIADDIIQNCSPRQAVDSQIIVAKLIADDIIQNCSPRQAVDS
jgi:hypothetical protein